MGTDTILVTLYDMDADGGAGLSLPRLDEVAAEIVGAGFHCVPRSEPFESACDVPRKSFACTAASLDSFDLLSVLIASRVVGTMIAPQADSLTVYVCGYGLGPLEIWDVSTAVSTTVPYVSADEDAFG